MKMSRYITPLFILMFCSIGHNAPAETKKKWTFLWAEDGIRMYRAEDAALPTFKAEGTIPVNFLDLLAVISDVSRRVEWVPEILESRILEGNVESRVIIHEKFNLPWPVNDRDCVVESIIRKDFEKRTVTVTYRQVTHPLGPAADGFIRIPIVTGRMQYSYIDDRHTAARYETTLDVGGSLPGWMVELAIKKAPLMTLQAAVAQVNKTQGQYETFVRTQADKLKLGSGAGQAEAQVPSP